MFRSKRNKIITSLTLAASFIFQIVSPTVGLALTSGPSQPEVQSFEPVSTTQMVDPFTGDFTYNIPLLDVGGYPVNISYHAGIGMDQEASWVGLGWNINPGVINRNMRGLPDDFDGDLIERQKSTKNMVNVGFDPVVFSKAKMKDEVFGKYNGAELRALSVDFSEKINYEIYYNNFKGVGYNIHYNMSKQLIAPSKTAVANGRTDLEAVGSIGLGFDSQNGALISPSVAFEAYTDDVTKKMKVVNSSLNVSVGYNSRSGLQSLGIGIGVKNIQKQSKQMKEELIKSAYSQSSSFGLGGSMTYSFANDVYTPSSMPNTFSYNYNARFKYYSDKSGSVPPVSKNKKNFEVNVGVNGIKDQVVYNESIGFLNEPNYSYEYFNKESVLMDVDNNTGVSFNKYTNNLAPIQNTYDVFSASAQGFGESFKPSKNYFQVIASPGNKIFSVGKVSLPFEFGKFTQTKTINNVIYARSIKIGADPELAFSWGKSGMWDDEMGNQAIKRYSTIQDRDLINSLQQKIFFKPTGEPGIVKISDYDALGGNKAMAMKVSNSVNSQNGSQLLDIFQIDGANVSMTDAAIQNVKRKNYNSLFVALNAGEASKFGLEKNLNSYQYNTSTKLNDRISISRLSNFRKPHHISEITTTNTQGTRYVYGLPVYNKEQVEYLFNVGQYTADIKYFKNGLVAYQPNDKSLLNDKGVDKFYSYEKTPSYVHSWMLTAVLSSDYVDVTGDGPTNDDLGSYTKFNYQKLASSGNNDNSYYNWRFPFESKSGNINRGLKSDYLDDKAIVTTGQREVWYLQSIETKTHIAIFTTSDREDGVEASSIVSNDGGLGSLKLKKLDRIDLYNIVDFYQNPSSRIPIKSVHFQYSYDLCPNVSNNTSAVVNIDHPLKIYDNVNYNRYVNAQKGKLTLHKIWFTYGSSLKGALNPYLFEYKSLNPEYAIKSVDRWGNYKPWNYNNGFPTNYSGSDNNAQSNAEFPYTPQETSAYQNVNSWASAWCLTDIRTPSGGRMRIEYESDDYAYVQNKRAMQMLKIAGFAKETITGQMSNNLYDVNGINNYIYFKMPDNSTNIDEYLNGLKSFYISCYVKLNEYGVPAGNNSEYEHIETFVDYDANLSNSKGTKVIGGQVYGYVAITLQGIGDNIDPGNPNKIHPVTKSAIQFMRMNVPHLAYPGNSMQRGQTTARSIIGNLTSFIPEFERILSGYEKYMLSKSFAKEVIVTNSHIRLINANGYKKGGGIRVKKLLVSDAWDEMTLGQEKKFESGYEYNYEHYDQDIKKTVSSGVASYEPLVGGNENPFRERVPFDDGSFTVEEKNYFAPNNFKYELGPIGENYFPGPVIGYSHVTVKKVLPEGIDPLKAKRHSNGKTVHEFYTSKDFPTIIERTPLKAQIDKVVALQLLGMSKESAVASQGFSIELNDMHGKLKSFKEYGEYDNKVVAGVEYEFLTEKTGPTNRLLNNVPMMMPNGEKVNDRMLGVDVEINNYADMREHNYLKGGAQVNAHFLYPLSQTPPLIPVISIIPSVSSNYTIVKQSIITKIIHKKGILKKVINFADDAKMESETLCWDGITGDPILTRIQNDRWTSDYHLSKPAHWVESGMSAGSINIDAEVLLATTGAIAPGEVSLSQLNGYGTINQDLIENVLFPGDELIPARFANSNDQGMVANDNSDEKYWVLSLGNGKANIIDRNGDPLPHNSKPYYFRIVRSGHRNLLGLIAESIMSISDPTSVTNWQSQSTMSGVINGTALIFSDKRQIYYQKGMKARINCELTQEPYYEEMTSTVPPFSILLPGGKQTDFGNSTNWPEYEICSGKRYYAPGQSVNPYVTGVRGNWGPWYSMIYYDRTNATSERTQNWNSSDPNQIDLRTAGLIQNYVPFFQRPSSQWVAQWTPGSSSHNQWTWKDRSNFIGVNGESVETIDQMGIYSSALYGYQKTAPIAVTANSQYHQMMFDGFEEYDQGFYTIDCSPGNAINLQYYPTPNPIFNGFFQAYSICNNTWHWPLWKIFANGGARVSQNKAHTGKQSLAVITPYIPASGGNPEKPSVSVFLDPNSALTGNYPISGGKFYLSQGDFIPQFYPSNTSSETQYYLISYWVNGNGEVKLKDQTGADLVSQQIGVSITVDGWTRIETKVTLPAGKSLHQIAFFNYNTSYVNNGSSGNPIIQNYHSTANVIKPVYFDDLRILPFMANMKSFVYDRVNKRLMANLSENNFATFIEYDAEGNPIRTKVETEKGIITVQETRSSINKK